ncbi:heterokaryon incompatibility protein-domain-containing protein [Phaeosphaeriaceae sp. PMI808]|nr:heterokaryon incompatibility protein-domain-containing protein [Phaeosphaeriaceae sp. PMI808]
MPKPSIYKPLNGLNKEIRLIEFHGTHSTNDEVETYSIIYTNLEDQPSFSALSYVWGDPSITEDINLDRSTFPVTVTLAAALKHARGHWMTYYPDRNPATFRLWADAICINQDDVAERSEQVQNMATIFSRADIVIAWLGSSTSVLELAFKTLEILWTKASSCSEEDFFKLEWMKNYPILYGWDQVRKISVTKRLVNEVSQEDRSQKGTHWKVLLEGLNYQATDPKDHIYGLLVLSNIDMSPDYSNKKPVDEVYRDYINEWLHNYNPSWEIGNPLKFLDFAGIGHFDNALKLSTWVPNFPEVSRSNVPFGVFGTTANSGVFSELNLPASIDKSILAVDGVELDIVSRLPHELQDPRFQFQEARMAYVKDLVSRHPIYKTGIPPLQAILHVFKLETSIIVNDNLVFYALTFLRLLMPPDTLDEKTHLKDLGIESGGAFNSTFLGSFFPEYQRYEIDWWRLWNGDWRKAFFGQVSSVVMDTYLASLYYRFCETSDGYFGLVPLKTQFGDMICVLNACNSTVLLRKEGDQIFFVGACFIVGLETGDAKALIESRGLEVQRFRIS